MSTDPFADLSVNEDQVIQSQEHFGGSAPVSKGEAHFATSPAMKRTTDEIVLPHKHWIGRNFLLYVLEMNEDVYHTANHNSEEKEKEDGGRIHSCWEDKRGLTMLECKFLMTAPRHHSPPLQAK